MTPYIHPCVACIGQTLLELVSGQRPWRDHSAQSLTEAIRTKVSPLSLNASCSVFEYPFFVTAYLTRCNENAVIYAQAQFLQLLVSFVPHISRFFKDHIVGKAQNNEFRHLGKLKKNESNHWVSFSRQGSCMGPVQVWGFWVRVLCRVRISGRIGRVGLF